MSDLPFGLETKNTYAALSATDLQSMGKQAAATYLCGGTSLNDAIIKLARQHPSISPHQVQRVVEYANQETFSKLFADNEKYASDKNIEFDVADPGDVLLELNSGASPQIMSADPSSYSRDPVKFAHSEVEADLALTRTFLGVDWASPGAEKTAMVVAQVSPGGDIQLLDQFSPEKVAAEEDAVDRVLALGEGAHTPAKNEHTPQSSQTHDEEAVKVAMEMGPPVDATQPPPQMEGAEDEEEGGDHHDQMLEVQREIELAKKRQELQKIQQQTLDQMNPQGAPGGAPAPGPGTPGQEGMPPEGMPPGGAPPAPPGGAPVEAAPPPPMPGGGGPMPQEMPPPMAGAMAAPPGGAMPKTGSASDLTKQAMDYAKSGRPHADLVLQDLAAATSLERIKEATAGKSDYPMANPYGGLIRVKQKVARLLEDANYAVSKNRELQKEASGRFKKAVSHHLWDGGNFGEVAHLMASVSPDAESVKVAMDAIVPELMERGLDPVRARAASIEYEMTKGAGARAPNPDHPITQAFADLCKLAEGGEVLSRAQTKLESNYQDIEKTLQEVALDAPSS